MYNILFLLHARHDDFFLTENNFNKYKVKIKKYSMYIVNGLYILIILIL